MAPEHVQKAFRVLASKLGRKDFDFTSKIIFLFLSFIFKVRICVIRIRKHLKEGSQFKIKKTFFSCWRTEEVIDEIILNESVDLLDKEMGTEIQYSILIHV
jgi:hypothetical protein